MLYVSFRADLRFLVGPLSASVSKALKHNKTINEGQIKGKQINEKQDVGENAPMMLWGRHRSEPRHMGTGTKPVGNIKKR